MRYQNYSCKLLTSPSRIHQAICLITLKGGFWRYSVSSKYNYRNKTEKYIPISSCSIDNNLSIVTENLHLLISEEYDIAVWHCEIPHQYNLLVPTKNTYNFDRVYNLKTVFTLLSSNYGCGSRSHCSCITDTAQWEALLPRCN